MMRRLFVILALSIATSFLFLNRYSIQETSSAQSPQITAIVGATLIDGSGNAPLKDAVVIVTQDTITTVGRRDTIKIPDGARVIEGPPRRPPPPALFCPLTTTHN